MIKTIVCSLCADMGNAEVDGEQLLNRKAVSGARRRPFLENHKPRIPCPKICLHRSLAELANFEYHDKRDTVAGARRQSKFATLLIDEALRRPMGCRSLILPIIFVTLHKSETKLQSSVSQSPQICSSSPRVSRKDGREGRGSAYIPRIKPT